MTTIKGYDEWLQRVPDFEPHVDPDNEQRADDMAFKAILEITQKSEKFAKSYHSDYYSEMFNFKFKDLAQKYFSELFFEIFELKDELDSCRYNVKYKRFSPDEYKNKNV